MIPSRATLVVTPTSIIYGDNADCGNEETAIGGSDVD